MKTNKIKLFNKILVTLSLLIVVMASINYASHGVMAYKNNTSNQSFNNFYANVNTLKTGQINTNTQSYNKTLINTLNQPVNSQIEVNNTPTATNNNLNLFSPNNLKLTADVITKELIKCNATIVKESNVYLNKSTDSELIDIIQKDQRVKIEPNQKTNSKFIKISYNNKNGDEIYGYVLNDNVLRDSWSILQIIGLVLVGLNVIFLIVLLFVKKRINHD